MLNRISLKVRPARERPDPPPKPQVKTEGRPISLRSLGDALKNLRKPDVAPKPTKIVQPREKNLAVGIGATVSVPEAEYQDHIKVRRKD